MIKIGLGKRRYTFTREDGSKGTGWYYQARWTDPSGKQMARSLKTQDKSLAMDLVAEIKKKVNAGVVPTQRSLGWEAAFATYRELHSTKASVTLEGEERSWKKFFAWAPVKQVHHVTAAHGVAWRDHMRTVEGLAARTTNDNLTRVGTVYNRLIRMGAVPCSNPMDAVDRLPNDSPVKDWLSPKEAARLLEEAKGYGRDLHLFVALGIYAGLRPKESLSARWDWVTFSEDGLGHIRIPVEDGDFIVKCRKARAIPLAPELRAILQFYRQAPRAFMVAPYNMEVIDRYRWNPRRSFAAVVKAAGLGKRKVTPYTLRHTFGSNAVNAGIPMYTVMDWMGHSDVRTLQIYGHMSPENPDIARVYAQEG